MLTIVFYGLVFFAVIMMVLMTLVGISLKPKLCWLSGILWYAASFLGSMTIGLYLLIFPFVLWTLALAHMFDLLKKRSSYGLFIGIGTSLWIISIITIDDYWLFFPFNWLIG